VFVICLCTAQFAYKFSRPPCSSVNPVKVCNASEVIFILFHNSSTLPLLSTSTLLNYLNQQVENFYACGSGYVIERLLQFVLVLMEYRPLCGSSYITTPKRLRKKHCVVNVQNRDQKCFLYSILSCLHEPPINKNRVRNYTPYVNTVNVDGLTFPVQTRDIPHFNEPIPKLASTCWPSIITTHKNIDIPTPSSTRVLTATVHITSNFCYSKTKTTHLKTLYLDTQHVSTCGRQVQ